MFPRSTGFRLAEGDAVITVTEPEFTVAIPLPYISSGETNRFLSMYDTAEIDTFLLPMELVVKLLLLLLSENSRVCASIRHLILEYFHGDNLMFAVIWKQNSRIQRTHLEIYVLLAYITGTFHLRFLILHRLVNWRKCLAAVALPI